MRFDSSIFEVGNSLIIESIFSQSLFNPHFTGIFPTQIKDFMVDDSISYFKLYDNNMKGWSFEKGLIDYTANYNYPSDYKITGLRL